MSQVPCLISRSLCRRRYRSGQSIAEVLVAIAVGVVFVGAAASLILPSLKSNTQVTNVQAGSVLAKGMLDDVRVFSEGNWDNLLALATGTTNTYFLQTGKSPFVAAPGIESIPYDNVTSGLVGEWKFGEAYGSSTIDSSGDGNNGTWNGTPIGTGGTYYAPGRIGQYSGDFDGSSDYATIANASSLSPTGAITLSAWIDPTSTPAFSCVLGKWQSGLEQYKLCLLSGVPYIDVSGSGSGDNYREASGTVPTGAWTYIVGIYSSSSLSMYVNGVLSQGTLVGTIPGSLFSGSSALTLGADFAGDHLFPGLIDDVRIYGRVLSSGEITQIYNDSYKRYFYLSDVYRASSGTIVSSGGSYDPSTKQVVVAYSWPSGATQTISTYLTRNENFVLDQTDWSGGAAPSGTVLTSTNSQFSTSSDIDYSTTTGSFYLAIPGY